VRVPADLDTMADDDKANLRVKDLLTFCPPSTPNQPIFLIGIKLNNHSEGGHLRFVDPAGEKMKARPWALGDRRITKIDHIYMQERDILIWSLRLRLNNE